MTPYLSNDNFECHMNIRGKILLPTVILLILSITIIASVNIISTIINGKRAIINFREEVYRSKKEKLRNVVEVAYAQLIWHHEKYKNGYLNLIESQEEALNGVKNLKYNVNDYFWINDREPKMIMHPNYSEEQKPEWYAENGLANYTDPDGKKLYVEFVKVCEENGQGFVDYYWTEPGKEDEKPVPRLTYVKLFEPWGWIIGSGIYIDDIDLMVEQKHIQKLELIKKDIILSGGALIIILLIAVMLLILISDSLVKPIKRMVVITNGVAKGDFTQNVNIRSKDEIGKLASNLNTAIDNLKGIISSVKSSSSATHEMSESLSANTEQTSSAVTEIAANIESIKKQFSLLDSNISTSSTAVEQILSNITNLFNQISNQASAVEQTSSSIEEMSASIGSVDKIAGDKKNLMDNLVSITQSGGEKVNTTNEAINEVSKNFDDMLEIIKVINNIASQTNLLSMNASIEAAHAGEYGKGFAVVADEIRKLAESTGINAKNVTSLLNSLVDKINVVLTSSSESGEAFARISKEVNTVSDAFAEISGSTAELANGSDEIVKAASTLLNITEEIKEGSSEMKIGAEEINKSLLTVKDISSQSLNGINEISIGVNEINSAVAQISDLSAKNKQNTDNLNQEIKKFKTE